MEADIPSPKMTPIHIKVFRRISKAITRRLFGKRSWPPGIRQVRLGDLATTRPISLDFGFDRGLPIDRYYVEAFLARHSADVAGHVMEVGDDMYSRKFGGVMVTKQDILHVEPGNPLATIIGDISEAGVLPEEKFDCIVLTQTLHLIFDLNEAIARLHAALRPGGVLLLTVPGITQVDRGRWGDSWFWSFNRPALDRLFNPVFGKERVELNVHGNVFSAMAMLQGLAIEEVDTAKLDFFDPAYPVLLTLRALKC